jgi:hypothetical protein
LAADAAAISHGMRTMFFVYLVFLLVGCGYFIVIGLTHS